jgi:hypothetical protein
MSKIQFPAKAALACVTFLCVACIPSHLRKYDKNAPASSNPDFYGSSGDPTLPRDKEKGDVSLRKKSQAEQPAQAAPQRATIYAVDKRTFRFSLKENDVWDAALNVLLRNYNVTIVDKQNGIITTEWDSYYLNNAVFRNRVSMRVGRTQWNTVDVTMHNNVEKLKDASQAAGTVGAVWLPAEDPANEISRIVQNMALVLNQPPPVMPPQGAVAREVEKEQKITY